MHRALLDEALSKAEASDSILQVIIDNNDEFSLRLSNERAHVAALEV